MHLVAFDADGGTLWISAFGSSPRAWSRARTRLTCREVGGLEQLENHSAAPGAIQQTAFHSAADAPVARRVQLRAEPDVVHM